MPTWPDNKKRKSTRNIRLLSSSFIAEGNPVMPEVLVWLVDRSLICSSVHYKDFYDRTKGVGQLSFCYMSIRTSRLWTSPVVPCPRRSSFRIMSYRKMTQEVPTAGYSGDSVKGTAKEKSITKQGTCATPERQSRPIITAEMCNRPSSSQSTD